MAGLLKFNPQLSPGDAAIDIGANVGLITQQLADAVGPTGLVLAVEPHPDTVRRLQERFTDTPQVRIIHAAVSDVDGQTVLFEEEADHRRCSLWAANRTGDGVALPVPSVTLDALVAEMPKPPAFIKIDAQGAEAAILRGARRTVPLPIRWVLEVWHAGLVTAGASVSAVLEPFQRAGYTPFLTTTSVAWDVVLRTAEQHNGHSAIDVWMEPPQKAN